MALRATTKAGYAGGRLRRLGARPWRRHGEQVPRLPPSVRPIPAGHTQPSPDTKACRSGRTRKDRSRSAQKSRKYDHPTIALSTFQPLNFAFRVRVRPKADFVSREAGFRARRKRRRCAASQGHGMAAAMLAWDGAVHGQQDRMAVRRDGGFRGRALAPLAM